ncbi:MAG TPA: 4Fe-4S binding protein [Rhodocyclaceae bacterium]
MEQVIPIRLASRPEPRTRLARLGDWMARHRRAILAIQWFIVLFYALLVVVPAFLPHPNPDSRLFSNDFGAASYLDPACGTGAISAAQDKPPCTTPWHDRLVLLAQYLFWGVWWPFVILSTMLMGRVWCGVLCPEGALTEFASRHGKGRAIPKWLRWSGWPVVAFILTTVYGQLVSVYDYPQATLLILGGSTVAAVVVGYLYGKGKRVWCRYLCPVSGVFALLARVAPLHFKVDRERWNAYPHKSGAVDCPPLLDVKHMTGASQCHACGRCAGHRDAVELAARAPNSEILSAGAPATPEAILLIFGVLGVAIGAFQWTVNPWFVRAKQAAAEWLIGADITWPLSDNAPWWLLTHYRDTGDVFTWLDGALILGYIALVALALGGLIRLGLGVAARLARLDWRTLAMAPIPLAGTGLFLGLSMMTANHLRAEGVPLSWLAPARAILLTGGLAWSGWLGLRLVATASGGAARTAAAFAAYAVPLSAVGGAWVMTFFVW